MTFSLTVGCTAAAILAATLIAVYAFRKKHWSRKLAIAATVICFQATFFIVPVPNVQGDLYERAIQTPTDTPQDNTPRPGLFRSTSWDRMIGDIFGRAIFAALVVSGSQGRWLWQRSVSARDDQEKLYYE